MMNGPADGGDQLAERDVACIGATDLVLQGLDQLAITLLDSSGWLAPDPRDPPQRWPESFSAAAFDQVLIEVPGRRMTFLKWYQPSDPPPSS